MPFQISRSLRSLESLFAKPDISDEERHRRRYLALCFLIITPALAGYAVVDLSQGRFAEALATLALVALLVVVCVLIPRLRRVWILFRIAVLAAVSLIFYLMTGGGGGGLVFLWLYTLPLIVYFLFGKEEGAVWVLACSAVLCVLFFIDLGFYSYSTAAGVRFMTTYGIISALGYGLEASRRRYYEELLVEKSAVEAALAQARTLSGLLPICVSCKSVRDDQGYWNQIETYLRRHSEAEFSHSLCPDCRTDLTVGPGQESHAPSS